MTLPDMVLFDRDCPLCRRLAQFASGRAGAGLRFLAWQEFQESPEAQSLGADALPADKFRVLTGGQLLEGEGAWGYLLSSYEDLAALNWLAAKLGLSRTTARVMGRSGEFLKKLCLRCR